MSRWLLIKNGIVVDIQTTDNEILQKDYEIEFDTVQLDNEGIFKECGEEFNVDRMIPIEEENMNSNMNFNFNPFIVAPK